MKSYNHLFEQMLDKDFIKRCIVDAAKHKTARSDVKRAIEDIDHNVEYIYSILKTRGFHIGNVRPTKINESSCNKERVIIRPDFIPDLVIQHMVIKILQPLFIKHFYPNSCASIPNKGPGYGRKILNKFIRENKSKQMYVFKCDIRKFFEHINRNILMNKLSKFIHDSEFLFIIHKIVFYDKNDYGIPLGFYSSQWFANFYLTQFDYYIKNVMCVPFMMRYMDDIVIIHFNKRKLRSIINDLKYYLESNLCLKLKNNYQLFKFDNRFIDYMGFKFYKNKTTLRKQTLFKIRRKVNRTYFKYCRFRKRINWYICSQLLSRVGSLKNVDCWLYFKHHISNKINIKHLRKIVSRHSRYENLIKNNKRGVRYDYIKI